MASNGEILNMMWLKGLYLLFLNLWPRPAGSWTLPCAFRGSSGQQYHKNPPRTDFQCSSLLLARRNRPASLLYDAVSSLHPVAAAGIEVSELVAVKEAIYLACRDLEIACHLDFEDFVSFSSLSRHIPGSTGRVVLLHSNVEDTEDLKTAISMELDSALASGRLAQPAIIVVDGQRNATDNDQDLIEYMTKLVNEEVQTYEMRVPLPCRSKVSVRDQLVPSLQVELDGAYVTTISPDGNTTWWDTSSVLVFDHLVSDDLRKQLLNVVLGRSENDRDSWNDTHLGPDPSRWVRGGLVDVAGEEPTHDEDGRCWGLSGDAIADLCFEHHDALQEFEMILSDLFPQFLLTRLPEAVLGAHVSPLTANAATHGDVFDYHIDADPSLAPPSPWTDVFGRYPNRSSGKPRFMSCLIYLNDEWDPVAWGAPTRFLDVATDTYYEVQAIPGRCVMMDQDITHTVVAPREAAGERPRYSLVWKLILHPQSVGQNMTDLAGDRACLWPKPILFGSAASREHDVARTYER